jgi:XTP/dITP diphosphohydrolase
LAQEVDARADLRLLPAIGFIEEFEEDAPTFAENAVGKALHYSKTSKEIVFADDSGLVVPALGGEPGVRSARYAGPNASSAERIEKLLGELAAKKGADRAAYFVCVIAVARAGRALAIVSDRVDGEILEATRGARGFGYDPVFYLPETGKSFAELSMEEKNRFSHRGKAFRRLLSVLTDML